MKDIGREAALCVIATFLKNTPSVSAENFTTKSVDLPTDIGFLLHSTCVQLQEVATLRITMGLSVLFVAEIFASRSSPRGMSPKSTSAQSRTYKLSVSVLSLYISTLCSKANAFACINTLDVELCLLPHEAVNRHTEKTTLILTIIFLF